MKIQDSVAFVTGANRGLGLALVHELLARGASKVYAGVRDPASIKLPGVIPIKLDVTNAEEVAAAAAQCGDVTLLINNAGIARIVSYLDPAAIDTAREILEANYIGPIRMSQAFTPILKRNGGGAIVNVLSVGSWINSPELSLYAASKSAAWGFTNGLRTSLREQGTQVVGLHVGFMDTDMTHGLDLPKTSPQAVAAITIAGVESGLEEVLADDITRAVKQGLSSGIYLAPPQR
ncbi:SDR family oxidoreductase [Collimonas sp. NPDC087041]|uniref:SDR family oxidoreductase n=1 Tax=Collimonas sp. NPDC087041 TaxID=3363960 RepID=UPI0038048BB4